MRGSHSDAHQIVQAGAMGLRADEVKALLAERGVLLESARGPIPNVAELIAGGPISGSWWARPASHAIFAAINAVADSP